MNETENRPSELAEITRYEKRERRLREIRHLAVLLFVFLALLLLAWGAYDYTYTCRIRCLGGTESDLKGNITLIR